MREKGCLKPVSWLKQKIQCLCLLCDAAFHTTSPDARQHTCSVNYLGRNFTTAAQAIKILISPWWSKVL